MRKLYYLIFSIVFILNPLFNDAFCQSTDQSNKDAGFFGIPVLPGVSGFGLDTRGGQGGKIIVVKNLNMDGEGSLAEAINFDGSRIIVFEVAGYIDLNKKSLRIKNPYLTIAGQTAPSPGITLINGGLVIGTHDVIVQHIKVRPGEAGEVKKGGWEVDGIATNGAYNIIIDHCSTSWSTDENLSASGPRFEGNTPDEWRQNTSHKITISNCIIAQGLSNSTHSKGEHSKGSLIHDNATEILVYGNLYADNVDRNPFFKGGAQGSVVNNFIYNPGKAAIHYSLVESEWAGHEWITGKMSVEGNYIEYGPNTSEKISAGKFNGPVELYWKDNTIISKKSAQELTGTHTIVSKRPVWPNGLFPFPSVEVKNSVLKNAGAFPWDRDEVDKKIIEGVRNGNGRIVNSETEAGGYPSVKPVYRSFKPEEWDMITLTKKKSDAAGWKENVSGQLPLLGHRNWILVVDKAFPAQTAGGIEVVNSGEPLLPVLEYVLQEIGESTHVKPVIYTDHELSFISPEQVPAIDGYRKSLNNLLEGFDIQTMLHDSVFVKIDQASRLFKVLVVKTEEVIPYSSVFIELDCSYWSPEQEQELRKRMR